MMMLNKLPYLTGLWDVVPVTIELHGGIGRDGSPEILGSWSGKVNYSEKARRVQDKEGRWISLSAVIHVAGDIIPGVMFQSGTVKVKGYDGTRPIVGYWRPRNPDGTVNHTRIEVA